jgi:hypothetical protein
MTADCYEGIARRGQHGLQHQKRLVAKQANNRWARAVASANKTPNKANAFSGLTPELSRPAKRVRLE